MKTTSHGRRPQHIKVEYLNNHLLDPTKMTKLYCTNPLNEDDLKILKVEYLSNPLDPIQILILSFYDQAIFCKFFKWRRPQNIKVEYLSNRLLDHTQIFSG
jgi:hypothetical protein